MSFWEWEDLQDIFENIRGSLAENDILPNGISRLSLERDSDQHLLLTTTSPPDFTNKKTKLDQRSPGEVFVNDNIIQIQSPYASGFIEGLNQLSKHTNLQQTTTKLSIHRMVLTFESTKETSYTFDWIANTPSNYIWTNGHDEQKITITKREILGSPPIKLRTVSKIGNFSNNCARLCIGGIDLVIGKSKDKKISEEIYPGYILYLGNPDSEMREKIRDSISFAFGTPIVYFGNSSFDAEYRCKSIEALSPHTIGGRAWEVYSQPPTSITSNRSNVIDRKALEDLANSFFNNADQYELQQIQWRIWYARIAPYYMAPAYYGALIETLQAKYTANPENKISSTVVDKASYRKLRKTLNRFLTKQNLSPATARVFENKISNGNSAPQKLLSERFYASLQLNLGVLELDAWDRRNDAAHGNPLPQNGEIDLIRETKILAVMVNRIMLKLIKGSNTYIDYYTFNYPLRPLESPIPADSTNP